MSPLDQASQNVPLVQASEWAISEFIQNELNELQITWDNHREIITITCYEFHMYSIQVVFPIDTVSSIRFR